MALVWYYWNEISGLQCDLSVMNATLNVYKFTQLLNNYSEWSKLSHPKNQARELNTSHFCYSCIYRNFKIPSGFFLKLNKAIVD